MTPAARPRPGAGRRRRRECPRHALGRLAGSPGWSLTLGRDCATGPVQIVHVSTGGANHLAAEIRLDEDAQASIVESFVGEGWVNRAASLASRARRG